MTAVGVLVPTHLGPPAEPPEARPIGRAALALEAEGVEVIFGDTLQGGRLHGHRAVPGGWEPASALVRGVHDRFPSQRNADRYASILAALGDVPLANPPWLTLLCRDKLRTQRLLQGVGVPQPPVVDDPAGFEAALAAWGTGFLKPRYGAFGRGVRRVVPGDPLPARGEGALAGVEEPLLLQRAVSPPAGWAGISLRTNLQRLPGGGWHVNPTVARRSVDDPVVNAHRGAEVVPGDEVLDLTPVEATARAAGEALAALPGGEWVVELGVDQVVDTNGVPWLIEVNSRPRGRLEALAVRWPERYHALHVEAAARPLRYLAHLP